MTGGYADLKKVKARINISDSITQADVKISDYMTEADTYVNTMAAEHAETPFNDPDKELIVLASGLAAALYNYWNKQGEFKAIEDYKKFILQHIRKVYGQKNPDGMTVNTFFITGATRGNESTALN